MRVEWAGKLISAELASNGTFFLYSRHNKTHLGIRADSDEAPGLATKGLVSLSMGYREADNEPSFFDLAALRGSRVYTLPDTCLVLPTERTHIHFASDNANWGPGAVIVENDQLYLVVAFNAGTRLFNLMDGKVQKDWPITNGAVWYSAWSAVRRLGDESQTVFEFKANLDR